MSKNEKPPVFDLAEPSRKVLLSVVGLTLFVLLLIAFSISAAVKILEPTHQTFAVVLLLAVPLFGLAAAVWLIFRNLNSLLRNNKTEIWELLSPEEQKSKFDEKIKTLASETEISVESLGDLRTAYLVAEDLGLRQIESERKTSVARRIRVAETNFDGAFFSRNAFNFVEVLFLTEPHFTAQKAQDYLKKTETVKRKLARLNLNAKIKLLLVLVTRMEENEKAKLRSILADKFNETPVDIDIRLLDFETLQGNFIEY